MAIYPIHCSNCHKDFELFDTKICPVCNSQGYIKYDELYTNIKTTTPFIYDLFKEGKGSQQDPLYVTDISQLKEEFKKREETGLSYISD